MYVVTVIATLCLAEAAASVRLIYPKRGLSREQVVNFSQMIIFHNQFLNNKKIGKPT